MIINSDSQHVTYIHLSGIIMITKNLDCVLCGNFLLNLCFIICMCVLKHAPIRTCTTIFLAEIPTGLKGKAESADLESQSVSAADETAASCGKTKEK